MLRTILHRSTLSSCCWSSSSSSGRVDRDRRGSSRHAPTEPASWSLPGTSSPHQVGDRRLSHGRHRPAHRHRGGLSSSLRGSRSSAASRHFLSNPPHRSLTAVRGQPPCGPPIAPVHLPGATGPGVFRAQGGRAMLILDLSLLRRRRRRDRARPGRRGASQALRPRLHRRGFRGLPASCAKTRGACISNAGATPMAAASGSSPRAHTVTMEVFGTYPAQTTEPPQTSATPSRRSGRAGMARVSDALSDTRPGHPDLARQRLAA